MNLIYFIQYEREDSLLCPDKEGKKVGQLTMQVDWLKKI